jgi:hypothetical protein
LQSTAQPFQRSASVPEGYEGLCHFLTAAPLFEPVRFAPHRQAVLDPRFGTNELAQTFQAVDTAEPTLSRATEG